MSNPLEAGQRVGPTSVVPEAPKVGLDVAAVVDRPVVGRPSEQVVGLRPAAVESTVLGDQPAATPAAQEVKAAPAPVK